MSSNSEFVSIIGSVEFDPSTRQVQGKTVRDVTIRGAHNQKKYRVTLWPNLDGVKVDVNDVIFVKGKGSSNTVDGDNGPVTYNNVSAYSVLNLGALEEGTKPATDNAQPAAADDDIPF